MTRKVAAFMIVGSALAFGGAMGTSSQPPRERRVRAAAPPSSSRPRGFRSVAACGVERELAYELDAHHLSKD